ncbi:MAG: hypothetical protein CM1200mP20_13430 [Pseudomonadota bacterium]|nr:MAG: hypothetical protein CM1200mP20_13430 [Pseudomonadota bacterium]
MINTFPARFGGYYDDGMQRKLGLGASQSGDRELVQGLLGCMAENRADFTLTFRRLCDVATQEVQHDGPMGSCSRIRKRSISGPWAGASVC